MSTYTFQSPTVQKVLDALHAEAQRKDPLVRQTLSTTHVQSLTPLEQFRALKDVYMPISPAFGALLYGLIRNSRAETVVEFGLSFGISTIYLASAVRDNGRGKVITTEFIPEKAERAKKNLSDAGLLDWVEVRVGDALETLRTDPPQIDFLLLDGAKDLYVPLLKMLEPRLRAGALVASDNTDFPALEGFLKYLRDPAHGYVSTALQAIGGESVRGNEISLRL